MRLLAKYNRINLLVTISVLLVSSVSFYIMIRHVLINQLDEDLKVEEQEIIDFVKNNNRLPSPSNYEDQQIQFTETPGVAAEKEFSSVILFQKTENAKISTRQYQFPVAANGKNYNVFVRKSQEQTEDLLQIILVITVGVVMLLLLVLFFINRFLLYRLWEPFNHTMAQIKQFDLTGAAPLQLHATTTTEFTELNKTVQGMTDRVRQDYAALKNFTENASHEMQTPLAIINSKLDVLIQDEALNEFQMQQLQGVYNAMDRLSNLNQSLLLLTRIENNQFQELEEISLDKLILEKTAQFEELTDAQKLYVSRSITPVTISGNRQLLDILFGNLLLNAIRYNLPAGQINIKLTPGSLTISNTSFLPALDHQQVFQRFYRHANTKQEGNGLGLSIVKQICNIAGYSIDYAYENDQHVFCINLISKR